MEIGIEIGSIHDFEVDFGVATRWTLFSSEFNNDPSSPHPSLPTYQPPLITKGQGSESAVGIYFQPATTD
jgi:hypothetical protein